MAKYYNNQKKTGKVAGSVFAIRFGETIERAYNPMVANPSTEAQVSARARLKLLSQLSAVLAPVIAIPRKGAVSTRNLFTQKNYRLASYQNDQANIDLMNVQLTSSVVGLPTVVATAGTNQITVNLGGSASEEVDRVVYILCFKQADGTLRYVRSTTAVAGDAGTFNASFPVFGTYDAVVYAYGIRDNTAAARAVFGNLEVQSADEIARIIVSSTLLESDVTLTETRAAAVSSQP